MKLRCNQQTCGRCLKAGHRPKVGVSLGALHKCVGVPKGIEVFGLSPIELWLRACSRGRRGPDGRNEYWEEDEREKGEHARFLVRGHVESRKLNLGAATKHGSFIYCGTPSNRDLVGEY